MKRPGAHRTGRLRAALWGILLLALGASSLAASCRADSPDPYAVKAAIFYNIARFVEWPSDAAGSESAGNDPAGRGPVGTEAAGTEAPGSSASFRIGVVGEDPFGSLLDELARSQTLLDRPIQIHRGSDPSDLDGCEMLFLGVPESELPDALAAAEKRGTLTVGEGEAFVRAGGAIGLVVDQRRVRFEVNLAATERADLRVSSKLLRLAVHVGRWPLAKEAP